MATLLDYLPVNWAQAISVDTIWETEVSVSYTGEVEERVQGRTIPHRVLNFQRLTLSPQQVLQLLRTIMSSGDTQLKIPLYPDAVELSSDYTSGGTTLFGTFQYRRFSTGKPALIVTRSGQVWEEVTVVSVNDTQMSISSLGNDYPAGSYVFPLLSCDYVLDQQAAQVLTDGIVRNQLTFRETIDGDTLLPPYQETGYNAPFAEFDGLPVFPRAPSYNAGFRFQVGRRGDQFTSGRGRVTVDRAFNARFLWSCPLRLLSRESWDEVMSFFSGRRGRLLPFYVVLPLSVWTVLSVVSGQVDVVAHDDVNTFSLLGNLGVVGPGGAVHVTTISNISDLGNGTWRLSIAEDLPSGWDENSIRFASAAVKARFSRDSIREVWDTTEYPRLTLEFESVFADQDLSSTVIGDSTGTSGGGQVFTGRTGDLPKGGGQVFSSYTSDSQQGGGQVFWALARLAQSGAGSQVFEGET